MRKFLILILCSMAMASCGQEAKFHSVYEKTEIHETEEKTKRFYECDYELVPHSSEKAWVCREIVDFTTVCDNG